MSEPRLVHKRTISSFFSRIDRSQLTAAATDTTTTTSTTSSTSTSKATVASSVDEDDFFRHCFGFDELHDDPTMVSSLLTLSDTRDRSLELRSAVNDASYRIGRFEMMPVNDSIEDDDDDDVDDDDDDLGSFSIRVGRGPSTVRLDQVDIGGIQADRANCGATIQVASNFNCLEYVSDATNASVDGITCYLHDRTQGPAASISAAPATAFRNYLVRHGDNAVGQLREQVNLLDWFAPRGTQTVIDVSEDEEETVELGSATVATLKKRRLTSIIVQPVRSTDGESRPRPRIPVRNGYIVVSHGVTEALRVDFGDRLLEFVGEAKVGVQFLTEVVFGVRRRGQLALVDRNQSPKQVVTQVFTATANLAGVNATAGAALLARFCLRAAYRGTILAARRASRMASAASLPGAKKCFLTLIGGGVFMNAKDEIVDAIVACESSIRRSRLAVTLVLFGRNEISTTSPAWQKLTKLVTRTNGTVDMVD